MARPNPGAQNSSRCPIWVAGTQAPELASVASQVTLLGRLEEKLAEIWDVALPVATQCLPLLLNFMFLA